MSMDPIMLSRVLQHYKRTEVQNELVKSAQNKEAVGSFGGKGYAKRPDVLIYPNDVLEQVKNGVTSFHVSEELWQNPHMISVDMKKHEYNEMRIGWDLVLDIDCPYWEFSKITTWLFYQSLKEHGIKSVTIKFSGNKGFHLGVPFESFPEKIMMNISGKMQEIPTKDLFPDGPRRIAAYLLDYIGRKHVDLKGDTITFGGKFSYSMKELEEKTGKKNSELVETYCESCGKSSKQENTKKIQFSCPQCESTISGTDTEQYKTCPKCGIIMERAVIDTAKKCCKNPKITTVFNPLSIVDVDTVLIAPRHLYRAPYSYHEKSGLVSIPIDPEKILEFEKQQAEASKIQAGKYQFLDRSRVARGEGTKLLIEAFDFSARKEEKKTRDEQVEKMNKGDKPFEEINFAVPEKFFPPCIQLISKGLTDGKKRAVFIMTNFLASCGWNYEQIEDWLKKWNQRNPEPLRDQYFLGQVRYAKQTKKKVLPPNCDNTAYYKSFGICKPDNFCKYISNPANYAIKRARYAQRDEEKGSKRKKKEETPKKE